MYKAFSKLRNFSMVLLFSNFTALAQDTLPNHFTPQFEQGKYYRVITVYGATYKGPVIEESSNDFVILDKKMNTKQRILKYQVKEVMLTNSMKYTQAPRFDDSYYANYYLISENALPFRKNCFNSTSHYFLLTNMNYSFNEHWSVSMNLLIFLPSSIGVKCSFKITEDIHFGGNVYAYGIPSSNVKGFYSPLFGSAARVTKGDQIVNFTVGAGVMAVRNINNTFSTQTDPYLPVYYVTFAYANRFSKYLALNIENFIFPQTISYSHGNNNINLTGISLKWIRDNDTHWNFGCYGVYVGSFTNLNKNSKIIPFPYIAYTTFFN